MFYLFIKVGESRPEADLRLNDPFLKDFGIALRSR